MYEAIRVFLRFVSFYLLLTTFIELPHNIYYFFSASNAFNDVSFTLSLFGKNGYYLFISLAIWLLAPYLARRVSQKYKESNILNVNIMLQVGLLLLVVQYLLEKAFVLANYTISIISLLEKKEMAQENLLKLMLFSPAVITTAIAIFFVILLFMYRRKIGNFLTQ
jgi:hypothetical protein